MNSDFLTRCLLVFAIGVLWLAGSADVSAQQIGVSTPFNTYSDSYFENHGVGFGFTLPGGRGPGSRVVGFGPGGLSRNLTFRQGSAGSAIPAFGGFDPNASARFGFGRIGRNGGGFNLGFTLGKGSSRTLTSTTPSLIVQNGFGGVISDTINRPFVTGVFPVVGNGGVVDNAVTRAIQSGQLDLSNLGNSESQSESYRSSESADSLVMSESSAQYGDESVSAIRARKAQRKTAEKALFDELAKVGLELEEQNNIRKAKVHYMNSVSKVKNQDYKKWFRDRNKLLRGRK